MIPSSLMRGLSLITLLAGLGLLTAGAAAPTLQSALTGIKTSGAVPTSLEVVYDDMHPLWGGMTVSVKGDGKVHMETRQRGQPAPTTTESTATAAKVMDLVKLLVNVEAWNQKTPDRTPVPDESRATLTVKVDAVQGGFWEWYNDLESNKRLSKVRDAMTEMAKP